MKVDEMEWRGGKWRESRELAITLCLHFFGLEHRHLALGPHFSFAFDSHVVSLLLAVFWSMFMLKVPHQSPSSKILIANTISPLCSKHILNAQVAIRSHCCTLESTSHLITGD